MPMTDLLKEGNLEKLLEATNINNNEDDKDDVPEYYHTGVKYKPYKGKDNVPHFRTHYECPRCGQTGRHYIPEDVQFVSCHNCQSKLIVTPATDKGFAFKESHRDEFGNFFVAKSLYIDDSPLYEK